MDILLSLEAFSPFNEREAADKSEILSLIKNDSSCFLREREEGHITVSAWIINHDMTKVLFCYHKIYESWSWVGGHADGERNLVEVAVKETREETGLEKFSIREDILSVEILPVAEHYRKGSFVPSHRHFNVTYLLIADEKDELKINPDENTGLKWIYVEDIEKYSSEKWMCENIYRKIVSRLRNM